MGFALKRTKLESYVKDVIKDLEKIELERRKEACKYAVKKIKEKLNTKGRSSPGGYPGKLTGNLRKGIKYKLKRKRGKKERISAVGSKAPHSHLLEFGHGPKANQNKRPFFRKTLLEENENIIKILSETYF